MEFNNIIERLMFLIETYPHLDWDWMHLSFILPIEFILKFPQFPWKKRAVSMNKSLTEEHINNNLFVPDVNGICYNQSISFNFYIKNIIKPLEITTIPWEGLSMHPNITIIDIFNNSSYPWKPRYVSMNPNLTSSEIINNSDYLWHIPSISSNPGINERDIYKNTLKTIGYEYDTMSLSANPNLPIAYVNDNLEKKWNFFLISKKASLIDIEKFPKIPWNNEGLSLNKNITADFVIRHNEINWDYQKLCMHIDEPTPFLKKLSDDDIYKYYVKNIKFPMETLIKNIHRIDIKSFSLI